MQVVLQDAPQVEEATANDVASDDCTLADFLTSIGRPKQAALLPPPALTKKGASLPAPP